MSHGDQELEHTRAWRMQVCWDRAWNSVLPSVTAPLWDSVSTSGTQGARDEAPGSPGGEERWVMSPPGRPCALDPATVLVSLSPCFSVFLLPALPAPTHAHDYLVNGQLLKLLGTRSDPGPLGTPGPAREQVKWMYRPECTTESTASAQAGAVGPTDSAARCAKAPERSQGARPGGTEVEPMGL